MDQPSDTMWCRVRNSTCSSAPMRSSRARSSGPVDRSKRWPASARARRVSSASRSSGGSAEMSSTGSGTAPRGECGACTTWKGRPPRSEKVVRRASCRRTMAVSAAPSAATSSAPRRRTALAMFQADSSGCSRSRNHNRCCPKDRASSPSRLTGTSGGAASASASRRRSASSRATPDTVGRRNTSARGSSTPKASRTRLTSRVASRLCPPRSKKLSRAPTVSTRSRSPNRPANTSSRGPSGGTNPAPASRRAASGAGSAAWSTLPTGLSGTASRPTNTSGTMWPGSVADRNSRSAAAVGSVVPEATTQATSRCDSPSSPRSAPTTHSRTPGWADSAASTSPGSMRWPRTFSWPSARPRKAYVPSGRRRTRSPVS